MPDVAGVKVPRSGAYLPQLDGVRALAVLMVVLLHCVIPPQQGVVARALRQVLVNGSYGVDLFFVLSGYLITSILLREKTKPHYFRNFYARRSIRIFPLYYLTVFVVWLAAPRLPFPPAPLWPFLTYTSNIWMMLSRIEWIPMSHAWSLAIEEQFYLVFPLVVLLLDARQLRRLLWAVVALSPAARLVSNATFHPGASAFLTFCRLDVLALGALVAVTFHEAPELDERSVKRLRIALAAAMAVCATLWVTKQLDYVEVFFNAIGVTIIEGTAALFVGLAVLDALPFRALLHSRLAIAIGRISYGIYLLHYPIAHITEPYVRQHFGDTWMRTGVIAAISIGATFPLAVISWFGFERPILRLKKRFYESSGEAARVDNETLDAPAT